MNMKTIKDKITKRINKQNVKGFFQKQGLYVLIFLCVAAAGITAIVAWPRDGSDSKQIGDAGTDAAVIEAPTLEEELAAATHAPTATPSKTATPTPTATKTVSDDTAKPVAASNGSGTISLKKPVEGKIITEFSGDDPVFFKSLDMWFTHNGVDIEADRGTTVIAALSGTIEEVNTNESDGGIIIISHSDKTQTVYAGLEEMLVQKADKVSVGQAIGKIGEMPKELDLSYHLHFEYIVDGIWKDPAKYF